MGMTYVLALNLAKDNAHSLEKIPAKASAHTFSKMQIAPLPKL